MDSMKRLQERVNGDYKAVIAKKIGGGGWEASPVLKGMRVLVVEDQPKFANLIRKGLEEQGMVVDLSGDGDEAYELATTTPYDGIILDIMLPGRDGLSILRGLREGGNAVPVILLTARAGLNERIEGLDLGADDYLPKPFYVEELVARLRTVVRRSSGQAANVLKVGDLMMNLATREVRRGETSIELTAREFSLLEYLMRSPERVFTRIQVCEHVWNYDFDPGTNLVDVYIQRVRAKVDKEWETKLIQTVRGVGYRIAEPS
ncbi:MAG: DNA-binding response OmpR family regulator [Verrucomicrobiales bacterium]|jgi:DNA-binding response OmpR family regulator